MRFYRAISHERLFDEEDYANAYDEEARMMAEDEVATHNLFEGGIGSHWTDDLYNAASFCTSNVNFVCIVWEVEVDENDIVERGTEEWEHYLEQEFGMMLFKYEREYFVRPGSTVNIVGAYVFPVPDEPDLYYYIDDIGFTTMASKRVAFIDSLDWQWVSDRKIEAVHHGVRFQLEGRDAERVKNNWGYYLAGGWSLQVLEPGDRVQMGLPWRHRVDRDDLPEGVPYKLEGEGKSHFDTLEEAQIYIEKVLIGRGIIDEMVDRDLFSEASVRYHVTLERFVPDIMRDGLKPMIQEGTGVSVMNDMTRSLLVMQDLKNEDWQQYEGEPIALLELDVSNLPRTYITSLREERVNATISPDRIDVVQDNIPWVLTDTCFSMFIKDERTVMHMLEGDIETMRENWLCLPEKFDEALARYPVD